MIYYFSGTGNSHYVAEVLSKSLQDTMQSIESAQGIKKDEMIEVNLSDGIINAKVNEIKEN